MWEKLETHHLLQAAYTPSQQHHSPMAALDGSETSPAHGGAIMNLVPAGHKNA